MPTRRPTSETVENYLKAVYTLSRESPAGEAAMTRLATLVGVTTGTATSMVKKLVAARLARHERFGGVRLTAKGDKAALDILRRHRLIETFLVETLKLDWSQVHQEAERLEHAVSPAVLAALDAHLNHPAVDPHGDPIPDADGHVRTCSARPISTFTPGTRLRITRIADQRPDFLHFIATHALKPGALAAVVSSDPAAQSITLQASGGKPVTLALTAAVRIIAEQA